MSQSDRPLGFPLISGCAGDVRSCAGFWTPAITKVEARSADRRPKSAKARSRGKLGPGWAASAMGI